MKKKQASALILLADSFPGGGAGRRGEEEEHVKARGRGLRTGVLREEVAGLGGSSGGGGWPDAENEGVSRDRLGMGGWIWEDPDGDGEWVAAAETRGIWWMGQSP